MIIIISINKIYVALIIMIVCVLHVCRNDIERREVVQWLRRGSRESGAIVIVTTDSETSVERWSSVLISWGGAKCMQTAEEAFPQCIIMLKISIYQCCMNQT